MQSNADQGETLFRVTATGLYVPLRGANRVVLRLETLRGGGEILAKFQWDAGPMRAQQATNCTNRVAELVAGQLADKFGVQEAVTTAR